jgi:outer membrane protein OmpA-like peptidoglycan-associated protein
MWRAFALKSIRIVPVATVLFVLLGCVTSPQVSQDAYLIDQGLKELSKGNYWQAEANLLVALDLNPTNPDTLLYLGDVYRNTGRMEKARQMYLRVIDLNPDQNAFRGNEKGTGGKSYLDVAKKNLESLSVTLNERSVLKDSDRDGVIDDKDKCPRTPGGATVNDLGCWVLKGVLFRRGQWDINPQVYPALDEVVSILEMNPKLKLEIQGHTDNRGSVKHNRWLSELRAKVVRGYLVKKGIGEKRLTYVGYGFSKPVATNDTPEGRTQNRRVELRPIH